jgi:hypothetical protein
VILAHHGGEAGIVAAAIAGTTALPGLVMVWRARLGRLIDRIRGKD